MRHQSTRRTLLRAAAAAAVLPIVAVASASPVHAQDEPDADPAAAAASWLAAQSSGDYFEFDGAPNVATTLDALIGLMSARVGGDQVQTSLEWLNQPDTLGAYVYPGGDAEDASIAPGAAGKVMYVVATAGGDPSDFGGVKLAEEVAAAPLEGLDGGTLAWAALGLSRTEDGVSPEITAALIDAQCSDGGFSYTIAEGGDCVGDPDTTGAAVAALSAIGEEAEPVRDEAVGWLLDQQEDDGGFDSGMGVNANSTAMAAQALLSVGESEAAELSVAHLIGLQIGCGDEAAGAIRASDPEDPEFGEASRLLATAQALVPLSGQNLAELDASGSSADVPATDCAAAGDEATTADAAQDDEGSASWIPWVIVAAAVVLLAIVAFLVVRARRGGEAGKAEDGE
ncbi:prenyltransferase/squalene oxidase repeat-containing protein [Glycomyces tarimensis]